MIPASEIRKRYHASLVSEKRYWDLARKMIDRQTLSPGETDSVVFDPSLIQDHSNSPGGIDNRVET